MENFSFHIINNFIKNGYNNSVNKITKQERKRKMKTTKVFDYLKAGKNIIKALTDDGEGKIDIKNIEGHQVYFKILTTENSIDIYADNKLYSYPKSNYNQRTAMRQCIYDYKKNMKTKKYNVQSYYRNICKDMYKQNRKIAKMYYQ